MLNEKLKLQLADRERTLSNIQRSMTSMEDRLATLSACQTMTLQADAPITRGDSDDDVDQTTRSMKMTAGVSQLAAMHDALRRIAREVIADCDRMVRWHTSYSYSTNCLLL